eukprot:snap_masked-scaffold_37-processed-gene-1.6-mRNA-1 protein AED:0.26 eAED:1.00 QI:0/0/0/0.5/1/1/2/0/177
MGEKEEKQNIVNDDFCDLFLNDELFFTEVEDLEKFTSFNSDSVNQLFDETDFFGPSFTDELYGTQFQEKEEQPLINETDSLPSTDSTISFKVKPIKKSHSCSLPLISPVKRKQQNSQSSFSSEKKIKKRRPRRVTKESKKPIEKPKKEFENVCKNLSFEDKKLSESFVNELVKKNKS